MYTFRSGRAGRTLTGALLVAALAAACGPQPGGSPSGSGAVCATAPTPGDLPAWVPPASAPAVIPVLVSGQQVCGQNRLLIGLLDPANRPLAAPDRPLRVAFYNLGRDPETAVATADAEFLWAIEGERGLYVTSAAFPEAGVWGAEVTTTAPSGEPATVRLTFEVRQEGTTAAVGERAPASKTPTLADVGGDVAKLSTDTDPDPKLYETSVDRAVADRKPFVLIFATPKFCKSAQCGPTLDEVKPFVAEFPTVTFINVEPYKLELVDGQLQPVLANDQLQPVASVTEWGLTSEPWIFVVDGSGVITASLEGVAGPDELRAAIGAVAG